MPNRRQFLVALAGAPTLRAYNNDTPILAEAVPSVQYDALWLAENAKPVQFRFMGKQGAQTKTFDWFKTETS